MTGQELADVINDFPDHLDEINITASLTRFVRFKRKKQRFRLPDALVNLSISESWQPRTIASVLWASGPLELPQLLGNFVPPLQLSHWSIRDLTTAVWGIASYGRPVVKEFIGAVAMSLSSRPLSAARNQELASFLWACAKSQTPITVEVVNEMYARVDSLNGQDISMIVWSLAKQQFEAEELYDLISHRLMTRPPDMTPQAMANIVWAFSVNRRKMNKDFFEFLAEKIDLRTLSQEQTSAVLLAYAKEDAALPTGQITWKSFPLREHLNCAWALARYVDSENFLPCIDALSQRRDLHKMTADDIYAITRALGAAYT